MDSEKPKDNKCFIIFLCNHTEQDPCVYFYGDSLFCKYKDDYHNCNSSLAYVNRMTLEIKRQKDNKWKI